MVSPLGAAIVLLYVLVSVGFAAVTPSAVACHNAPLTATRLPQVLGVLISAVGFILGRVTARPKIKARAELMSWTLPGDSQDRLAKAALLTQAALTAALLFIAVLIAFEAVTLATGFWPITYYLRCANEVASWQTFAGAFAFCFLVGRWLWLPTTPED